MDDDTVVKYGHSTRVDEDAIRQYKWTDEKLDSDAFLYQNVINFKRSANPRGHAHHCVMCGDKRAAIPSQNKDVCKSCDSGYWLVENIQILVKFCKGCKNFTKLHDFRDKPEATKCIKCRQRGRQNYFAKKGRVDVLPNPHPRSTSQTKHSHNASAGVGHQHHLPPNLADPAQAARYTTSYDLYGDVEESLAPRLTSNRQKDMQKNRISRYQERTLNGVPVGPNAAKYMKNAANAANMSQSGYPPDMMMMGFGPRRDRSNSINSLLHGYNELPLDFQMYDGGDYDINDAEGEDSRSRSNTLLSMTGSMYSGDDKNKTGAGAEAGAGTGAGGRVRTASSGGGGRNRTTSEEWGNLAQASAAGQFHLVSHDMFKDPAEQGGGGGGGSGGGGGGGFQAPGAPGAGVAFAPSVSNGSVVGPGGSGDRKRRVSIDLTNYFSGGWTAAPAGDVDGGDGGPGGGEAFESKRARNNSISEILSSII